MSDAEEKIHFDPSLIHCHTRFSSQKCRGPTALVGIEIAHGFQQSQIVMLAPHRGWTKQGRRYNHATSSLDDHWSALL